MENRKNILWFFAVVAIVLVMFVLKYTLFQPAQPIRIGLAGSVSGKFAAMGTSARNGVILFIEELNRKGGINNRPLEVVVYDDGGDKEKTLANFERFHSQGIDIVVGPFTTASATRVLPYINKQKILAIGAATAGENLAGQDDYFIKLYPSTKTIGEKTATMAAGMGTRSISIIYDKRNERFAETMIEGFISVFIASGGKINVKMDYFSNQDISFNTLGEQLTESDPDAAFLIASSIDTAMLAQKVKKEKPDIALFTSPWAISSELIENGGESIEGLRYFVPYIKNDTNEKYQDFIKRYEKRFSEPPTHVAGFNYEAMHMLARGLAKADTIEPDAVKRELLKIKTFEGLQSDFSLNANGDALRQLYLHEVRNRTVTHIEE